MNRLNRNTTKHMIVEDLEYLGVQVNEDDIYDDGVHVTDQTLHCDTCNAMHIDPYKMVADLMEPLPVSDAAKRELPTFADDIEIHGVINDSNDMDCDCGALFNGLDWLQQQGMINDDEYDMLEKKVVNVVADKMVYEVEFFFQKLGVKYMLWLDDDE